MANYLPTLLEGSARSWLLNQPLESIYSWQHLCDLLLANFQGTYHRPGKEDDLHRMRQNDHGTLCQFIQRFSQVRNSILEVSDSSVIRAFKQGVHSRRITEDIALNPPASVVELFEMADQYVTTAEAVEWNNTIDREDKVPQEVGESGKKKDKMPRNLRTRQRAKIFKPRVPKRSWP